jgi:hypothetical protein
MDHQRFHTRRFVNEKKGRVDHKLWNLLFLLPTAQSFLLLC